VQDETLGANVSVRSLVNPVKAGRIQKLTGENEWKTRYAVLMGDDQKLFIFESENSLKPKGFIEMRFHTAHVVDDSYLSRPYCLQIVSDEYTNKKEDGKIHFFSCDSEEEKLDWLKCLRLHDASKQSFRSDDLKVLRSIKLEIVEGRDLPNSDIIRRTSDPYVLLYFNQIPFAKTVIKYGTQAPFWGESFYFDNIHPRIQNLTCSVYSRSRLQKDPELGKVFIPFDVLELNKQHEEWYQLVPPSFSEADTSSLLYAAKEEYGAIRLKITLIEEKVLPLQDYQSLFEMIIHPEMAVVRKIGEVVTKEREELARRLLKVFSCKVGGCVEFLRILTHYEIFSTEDSNILFRGNSLATKAVDQYMKMVGTKYLQNTLKNLVMTVYKDSQSCEVDPTRVEKADEMKRNWKRLMNYVTLFWETIANAADKCPWELKLVFYHLQKDVMDKFNNEKVKHIAVAGFIFLRFFCPAILDPKLFGMAQEHPDPNTARTFTLVAKTIQNLANLVEFGAKEPYMADMNPFILKNIDAMKTCIEKFSTCPKTDQQVSIPNQVDVRRELASLYKLFTRLAELSEAQATHPDEVLTMLFEKMSEIGEIYSRYNAGSPLPDMRPMSPTPQAFRRGEFSNGLQLQNLPKPEQNTPPLATSQINTSPLGSQPVPAPESNTPNPPPKPVRPPPKPLPTPGSTSNLVPAPIITSTPTTTNPAIVTGVGTPTRPTPIAGPPVPPKTKINSAAAETTEKGSGFKFLTRSKSIEKMNSQSSANSWTNNDDIPKVPPPSKGFAIQEDMIKELAQRAQLRQELDQSSDNNS